MTVDVATLGLDVDTSKLKQAERAQEQFGKSAEEMERRSKRATDGINTGFKGLGLAGAAAVGAIAGSMAAMVSIDGIARAAGQYQSMSNALRGMGLDAGQAAQRLDQISEIATRTRAPLDATVKLYSRISIAAGELGASQDQVAQFTENVGMALGSAGIGANEASGALMQLSQAMSGGTVRAEEFNSILEGAFPLAQAAARGIDEAGGSVGKLRQLVIAGKISSEEFFNAILAQGGQIKETFGNTSITVGQAFTNLGTSLIMAIGQMDSATGASSAFASVINSIAQGVEGFAATVGNFKGYIAAAGIALAAAGVSFAATFLPSISTAAYAVGLFIGKMITLKGVLMTTGIGALVVAAGYLLNEFFKLSDSVGGFSNALAVLKSIATEAFGRVGEAVDAAGLKVNQVFQGFVAVAANTTASVVQLFASAVDTIIGAHQGAAQAILAAFGTMASAVGSLFVGVANSIIGAIEGAVNFAISGINRFVGSANSALAGLSDVLGIDLKINPLSDVSFGRVAEQAGTAGKSVGQAFNDGFNGSTFAGDAVSGLTGSLKRAGAEAQNTSAAMGQLANATMNNAGRPLQSLQDLGEAQRKLAMASNDTAGAATTAAAATGKMGEAAAGAAKGMSNAEKEAEKLREEMQKPLTSAIDSVSNAFGDFVARGFKDFKGFANSVLDSFKSMLAQMISMAVKNRIMIGLGIGGGSGGMAKAATGGGMFGKLLGGGGGGGGMLGTLIGGFGTGGTGLAGLAGGTGIMGGLGNVVGGFASGGLSGGLGAIGSGLGGAFTGGMAGFGAALGAAIPIIGAVALLFGAFSKKVKELDSGVEVTINGMSSAVETFRKNETSRFFGIFKNTSTDKTAASKEVADPINKSVAQIQSSVLKAAEAFGFGADAFAGFSYKFSVSLKGLSQEDALKKVNDELNKMGNAFAGMLPQFSSMNELLEAHAQRIQLEDRLLGLQGKSAELLARQRERELMATHELNRPLLQQIHALEDQAQAAQKAADQMQRMMQSNMFETAADRQFAATSFGFSRTMPTQLSEEERSLMREIVTAIREGDINQARLTTRLVQMQERAELEPTA